MILYSNIIIYNISIIIVWYLTKYNIIKIILCIIIVIVIYP